MSVFDPQHALTILDRIVDGEERWQTLGSISGVLLILARAYAQKEQRPKLMRSAR